MRKSGTRSIQNHAPTPATTVIIKTQNILPNVNWLPFKYSQTLAFIQRWTSNRPPPQTHIPIAKTSIRGMNWFLNSPQDAGSVKLRVYWSVYNTLIRNWQPVVKLDFTESRESRRLGAMMGLQKLRRVWCFNLIYDKACVLSLFSTY